MWRCSSAWGTVRKLVYTSTYLSVRLLLYALVRLLPVCRRPLRPLLPVMCTTTTAALITTVARTSAHPSLRAVLRSLRRVTVIRIVVEPLEIKKQNSPGFSGAVLFRILTRNKLKAVRQLPVQ